jgi:hypothetical protein
MKRDRQRGWSHTCRMGEEGKAAAQDSEGREASRGGDGEEKEPIAAEIETGVLDPRTKLLRFHMPGPVTCP